ncbi:MAG: nucleotide exchange factor GrpE [Candidatus Poseidoniales archaeon]|nr:MAG: nucleotide exchange factor GrpE [Candidatus Poseidoniales archaeon]
MSDEEPAEEPVEDVADQAPPTEEPASDADPSETVVEEPEEERDPLEVALERADFAEKEIAYKEAEIQNVRKRLMADKAEAIQYGGMGMARRMLTILGDVDRAMSGIEEDDQSPVAQGLRLLRNKMWHELQADGVTLIEAKGAEFDPSKMEAIATIPPSDAHPNGTVVDVLEQGYMYKSKVILAARVVVASE